MDSTEQGEERENVSMNIERMRLVVAHLQDHEHRLHEFQEVYARIGREQGKK